MKPLDSRRLAPSTRVSQSVGKESCDCVTSITSIPTPATIGNMTKSKKQKNKNKLKKPHNARQILEIDMICRLLMFSTAWRTEALTDDSLLQ